MKVSEVMVRDVVSTAVDEKIGKVLVKMGERKIHQIPLVTDGKYDGMIIVKDLVSASYDPEKTGIGIFKRSTPVLSPDDTLEVAAFKIVGSGYNALPVVVKGKISGILSLTELINYMKYAREDLAEHFASGVATVNEKDSVKVAQHLMDERGVSRLPVVDDSGIVKGCFDVFCMIEFVTSKQSPRFSRGNAIEKESLDEFVVKDNMRETATMEASEFSLNKVTKLLQKSEEVILTGRGKPIGIIIPKDIIEHAIVEELPPIQISHYAALDPSLSNRFYGLIEDFVRKYSKFFQIQRVFVYTEAHKREGSGSYSLRARVITPREVFISNATEFDLIDAAHSMLGRLETQMTKSHDKYSGAPLTENVREKLRSQPGDNKQKSVPKPEKKIKKR